MIKLVNNNIKTQNQGIVKTFFRMFLGLLATTISAFAVYKTGLYMEIPYMLLAILEIAVVLIFSFMFKKLSPTMATVLFYSYSIINGITMGTIFAAFNITTVFKAFFTTSLLFAVLALYGYKTNKDLTQFRTIFSAALIVGLIVSIINLFVGSSMINIILDWGMLLVFCGLTAHDMNNIKYMQNYVNCDEEKIYIYCAMDLYLDFINIFVRLLSIFAKNEND